jgi:hypothetical protein
MDLPRTGLRNLLLPDSWLAMVLFLGLIKWPNGWRCSKVSEKLLSDSFIPLILFQSNIHVFNVYLIYRSSWHWYSGRTPWTLSASSKNKWTLLILSLASQSLAQSDQVGRKKIDLFPIRELLKRSPSKWETCKGLEAQHRTPGQNNR